jgi:ABC-type hemin transport system ATPase subunit
VVSNPARGKELLINTDMTIVHGRRYGLVGPNGAGLYKLNPAEPHSLKSAWILNP